MGTNVSKNRDQENPLPEDAYDVAAYRRFKREFLLKTCRSFMKDGTPVIGVIRKKFDKGDDGLICAFNLMVHELLETVCKEQKR